MTEPVDWHPDGTPHNARFGDIYNSCTGGLEQAQQVFLQGCGLPEAWAGQAQWRVLETGFGLGLNFLATWQAWRVDAARPRLLHFASIEAYPVAAHDLLRAAARWPALLPLAEQLCAQWWGLLPGVHRLSFDDGQVLLTLAIGDVQPILRELHFEADAVYLDGFSPQRNPAMWSLHTLKAVARLCRRGTRVASWTVAHQVRHDLAQCGFTARKVPGLPPKRDALQSVFEPAWEPRRAPADRFASPQVASHCAVVGAGLAGAAVAASLARRGWQVQVLDAAPTPASGASGLPVGLFAPHVSPDDSVLSRLSRSGIRSTLCWAEALLEAGRDWQASGVLEHRVDGSPGLPADWPAAGLDWSERADAQRLTQAGLAAGTPAVWHRRAGWVRPARLVQALLAQPGVAWQGNADVQRLEHRDGHWRLLDGAHRVLAEAPLVVLAAGCDSRALAAPHERQVPLQAIRGQLSWNWHDATEDAPGLPPFPVNGHGHLVPSVPVAGRAAWCIGATFERDNARAEVNPLDHAPNLQRLQTLLPGAAAELAPSFAAGTVQAWAGIRCAAHDRLPLVGALGSAGLYMSTAMGSRGLSWALLCAELLAAGLHGEPLPLGRRLARLLDARRFAAGPEAPA